MNVIAYDISGGRASDPSLGYNEPNKATLTCSQVNKPWLNKTRIEPASIDLKGLKHNEFRYDDTRRVAAK